MANWELRVIPMVLGWFLITLFYFGIANDIPSPLKQ